jgi:hypothetical protein
MKNGVKYKKEWRPMSTSTGQALLPGNPKPPLRMGAEDFTDDRGGSNTL